jgi:hypothetical protein
MATQRNPYFKSNFINPGMSQVAEAFAGLASVFAPQQGPTATDMALIGQRDASAQASLAQAGKYEAETAGIQAKNDAFNMPPGLLAELFSSGGRFTDDPLVANPDFQMPGNTDFSLDTLSRSTPAAGGITSMFLPSATADMKMAGAMQELLARGGKVDDIAKVIAQAAYLKRAMDGQADDGMPLMPLFGSAPTTSTALTTQRQDAMSQRDADEASAQALAVARQQGDNSARVARINQDGASARQEDRQQFQLSSPRATTGGGGREPTPIQVKAKEMRDLKAAILAQANNRGIKKIDDAALDALATEAAGRFQQNRNMGATVQSIVDELEAGTFEGLEMGSERAPGLLSLFTGQTQQTVKRAAPALPAASRVQNPTAKPAAENPNIIAARDAIARGAPREAVIQRLKAAGIDPSGL